MRSKFKNFITPAVIIGLIFVLFWFANFFGSGEKVQSEAPLVICNPSNVPSEKQKCFWTAHIHAHVEVFKNGKAVPVGFEQGELEEEHTHSEPNKLHWHGLIPVDPKTKDVKDWSSLRIDTLPKDLKLSLEGQPRFIVNGQEVDPSNIWKDGDHIEIQYD